MSFFTTSDQQQLYYKDLGDGPLVVFIHGWPLSADSWDEIAMTIAANGYRTIAYDRRGFGRSSQPWHGYDYNRLADDVAELLLHVGAENATLVGFSMGGAKWHVTCHATSENSLAKPSWYHRFYPLGS